MLQEREAEFERVHPTLSSISTLHTQFQEFAEESALEEAKESLETLKERWQTVIQSLAARQRQIQVCVQCSYIISNSASHYSIQLFIGVVV